LALMVGFPFLKSFHAAIGTHNSQRIVATFSYGTNRRWIALRSGIQRYELLVEITSLCWWFACSSTTARFNFSASSVLGRRLNLCMPMK